MKKKSEEQPQALKVKEEMDRLFKKLNLEEKISYETCILIVFNMVGGFIYTFLGEEKLQGLIEKMKPTWDEIKDEMSGKRK